MLFQEKLEALFKEYSVELELDYTECGDEVRAVLINYQENTDGKFLEIKGDYISDKEIKTAYNATVY